MKPNPAAAVPDIRQVGNETLPPGEFPGGKSQEYRIHYASDVHRAIWTHATESIAVEVCGVLVGRWSRDAAGPFLSVVGSIRGEAAQSKFTEVTFTHETWAKINDEMDKHFADYSIVGWYHTHPDFGIFLSERDTFIQQHFFSGPGQVAHVVDPVRKIEGIFVWKQGKPALAPFFWSGDEMKLAPAGDSPESQRTAAVYQEQPAHPRELDKNTPRPPTWERVLMYVLVFLIGYLLAVNLTGQRSNWEQARLEEGVIAHYGVWTGLRPGFAQAVELLSARVAQARQLAQNIADDAHNPTKDAKLIEVRQGRHLELQQRLAKLHEDLGILRATYALSSEEAQQAEKAILEKLAGPAASLVDTAGDETARPSTESDSRTSKKSPTPPSSARPKEPGMRQGR